MPGASPHPVSQVSAEPAEDVQNMRPRGNDAGFERAELRLTRALERLEAAVGAKSAQALGAEETAVRLRGENARLEAENAKLSKARDTVETRLDAAIGRLSGLLGTES